MKSALPGTALLLSFGQTAVAEDGLYFVLGDALSQNSSSAPVVTG